ncbi:MAG: heme-binding domain-containing protein [Pyrinomonadaceae bacterium]
MKGRNIKKVIKIVVMLAAAAFVSAQFIRPTFVNPPLVAGAPIEDSVQVPAEVQMVLSRSCNDCHSNKTLYPWYSQISPFSWFLAGHIEDGRAQLNFSEWNTYSAKKKAHKLEEISEMVESGEMPLPSYLWIHRDAALNADQIKLLSDWAKGARALMPSE